MSIRILGVLLILMLPGLALAASDCDLRLGQQTFDTKCALCHSRDKEAGNAIGPNLYHVPGGPVGKADGFVYSSALAGAGGRWTPAALDRFLASPQKAMPGTVMPFRGLKSPTERAAVICFLQQP